MVLPTDYYKIVEVHRAHNMDLGEFNTKVLQMIEEMNQSVRHPGQAEWRIVSMTINCDGAFGSADKVYSFLMQMHEG